MALKKCKECGYEISSRASKCPRCGNPIGQYSWATVLAIVFIFVIGWNVLYYQHGADQPEAVAKLPDCQPHVEFSSTAEYARQLGRPENWVAANFRINVWSQQTPEGKGKKVGEMRPGSRALLLGEGKQDFKVRSPLDGSVGWVNKIQAHRIVMQDVNTRRQCK